MSVERLTLNNFPSTSFNVPLNHNPKHSSPSQLRSSCPPTFRFSSFAVRISVPCICRSLHGLMLKLNRLLCICMDCEPLCHPISSSTTSPPRLIVDRLMTVAPSTLMKSQRRQRDCTRRNFKQEPALLFGRVHSHYTSQVRSVGFYVFSGPVGRSADFRDIPAKQLLFTSWRFQRAVYVVSDAFLINENKEKIFFALPRPKKAGWDGEEEVRLRETHSLYSAEWTRLEPCLERSCGTQSRKTEKTDPL